MADLKKQDMTVFEFKDYTIVKTGAEKVGAVPFVGETAVGIASALCAAADMAGAAIDYVAFTPSRPMASCQALKDTLGELNSPAFPKGPDTPAKVTSR